MANSDINIVGVTGNNYFNNEFLSYTNIPINENEVSIEVDEDAENEEESNPAAYVATHQVIQAHQVAQQQYQYGQYGQITLAPSFYNGIKGKKITLSNQLLSNPIKKSFKPKKYLNLTQQSKKNIYSILGKMDMNEVGSLNLSYCELEDIDMVFLLTLPNINIEWLDISNNKLTFKSLKYLCQATIDKGLIVSYINLSNNLFEDPMPTFERDTTSQHIINSSIRSSKLGEQLNALYGYIKWMNAPMDYAINPADIIPAGLASYPPKPYHTELINI